MKKTKGMKIYKQKKRKNNSGQALSVLLTLALVVGVALFGYYVVGRPFSEFIDTYKSMKSGNSSGDDISTAETTEQTVPLKTEPVTQTEAPVTKATQPVTSVTSSVSVTVTSSSTTVPVTSEKPVTTVTTQPAVPVADKGGCLRLSSSDLYSAQALEERLESVEGYDSVILPLKVTGGSVYYDSYVDTANYSGVIESSADIETIVKICAQKGLAPVAEISTINDNLYALTYKKSAYQFDDGYTGEWLDGKPENGGKPWLSPFSDLTKEYLSDLVSEITAAGIKKVICTDTVFPPFREKDLGYIGEIVQSEDRYRGLTDLINLLDSKASENGAEAMLYVTYSDAVNSSAEVFHPEEFGTMHAVVGMTAGEISERTASGIMNSVSSVSGSMRLIPCIISDGMSSEEISSAVKDLEKSGYDFYMVR